MRQRTEPQPRITANAGARLAQGAMPGGAICSGAACRWNRQRPRFARCLWWLSNNSRSLRASSPISCCDVSNIAFHTQRSRRGRHDEPGARDVRLAGLRFGRVRTGCEIGRACDRSGAGAPRFGLRERPLCGDTTTSVATRASGLQHPRGGGRRTRQKAAKAAYRKLPAASADLCAAAVRRSRGFCAGDCPLAKRRAARTQGGGARRMQRVCYRSTSDRFSRQTARPWVAA